MYVLSASRYVNTRNCSNTSENLSCLRNDTRKEKLKGKSNLINVQVITSSHAFLREASK